MRLLSLTAAAVLLAAPALAQAPAAALPPGYTTFPAPIAPGSAPGMSVKEFSPGAGKVYRVAFKTGDEPMNGLIRFATAHPMTQAALSGVGGISSAVLSWYDPKVKALKLIKVDEKCEITGVTGTITTDAKGRPNVHLHVVLARQDGSSVSGHLISAVIDPIMEVFVTDLGPGKDVPVP
jgi:predicted DNA-binding protein with PD1-like motif